MSDKIDDRLIISGFLKAKKDDKTGLPIYPITPDGLMALFSNFIVEHGLQETISVSFLNEVIQIGSKCLYSISTRVSPTKVSVYSIRGLTSLFQF